MADDEVMAEGEMIGAVRHFNRFYTRQIGLLRRTYLGSPYALGEMRVLYEIANGARTATEIIHALELDAGYLSRVLRQFEKQGLISRKRSKSDARRSELTLTSTGRKTFALFERRSNEQVAQMLSRVRASRRNRMVRAMEEIEAALGDAPKCVAPHMTLRAPRAGDYGWVISRHAELYWQEYQWGEPFEGLCAQIVADFANGSDRRRERCWIADSQGENVGCVMLVRETDEIARLRLLLVDPKARGLGLGKLLVQQCVSFARASGYSKITLWTHSVLTAARHIYEGAGFRLTSAEPRHTWGQDVVAEFWDLEL